MNKRCAPKGGIDMATNTFERKIVINDSVSKEKLAKVLESAEPARKLTKPLYSGAERERSEKLLAQCLFRSKR